MKEHGCETRRPWRIAGFLFLLLVALGTQAQPPSVKLPGCKPDSREPWGAFLGRSAHLAIGLQYKAEHPSDIVFLDANLFTIVKGGKLGDAELLPEFVKLLRPDIANTDTLVLFEIKPDTHEGLQEARAQAGRYLAALNAATESDKKLRGGTGCEGALFLEFEDGGALWQLSWRTPEPGVTLYRWSFRRKQSGMSWKDRVAQPEEALPRNEAEQRGEMAEQAIRAAYEKGELPRGFQGQVYLPVECQ